ncbi:hypothetical protein BDN72DRAFT_905672 [Pluteus cervinus]|uniref:Uncharacterized protein n=1 Tax=Pluteus cervinus TaxID=181527 RepID=A0ACD3A2K9_9AGAR|nr:hypothetical protein BDN72DRAFT_905672 [Pluteus cervinus]
MSQIVLESTRAVNLLVALRDALKEIQASVELARSDIDVITSTDERRYSQARTVREDAGSLRDRFRRLTALYDEIETFINALSRRTADAVLALNVLLQFREGRLILTENLESQLSTLVPRSTVNVESPSEELGYEEEESADEGSEGDSTGSRKRTREADPSEGRTGNGAKKAKGQGQGSFRTNTAAVNKQESDVASTSNGITRGEAFTSVSSASTRLAQAVLATPSRSANAYTSTGFFTNPE